MTCGVASLYTLSWTIGFIIGPAVAGIALGADLATPLFVALMATCVVVALVARGLEYISRPR